MWMGMAVIGCRTANDFRTEGAKIAGTNAEKHRLIESQPSRSHGAKIRAVAVGRKLLNKMVNKPLEKPWCR